MIRPRLLINAESLPDEVVKQIHCGDYILVHNSMGGFWTQVADVKERGYFDTICTSKITTPTYTFGDLLRIHRRHIFEIRGSGDPRVASIREIHQA